MKIGKILKINKKLSNEFALLLNPFEEDGWILVRTRGRKEILNSKTSTDEELKKFVKEHSFYNIMDVLTNGILITNSIGLLLSLANTVIHSTFLSGIVSGMLLLILPALITLLVVDEKNSKTQERILNENKEELDKSVQKMIDFMEKFDIEIKKKKAESEKKEKKTKNTTSKTTKSKPSTTKKEKAEVKAKSSTTTPRKRASKKGEEKKD